MSVWKSGSLGYTSPAATFTDATTGAKDPRKRRIWERATAAWHVGNVPSAGAWAPTCPCGWAVSLRSTWTPEPPPTFLYHAATSPQRGQPSTGPRPRCLTGRTRSGPSAPSAPLHSAHPGGRGSSSRARSTNRHFSETTVTGRYPSFIPAAHIDQWSLWVGSRQACYSYTHSVCMSNGVTAIVNAAQGTRVLPFVYPFTLAD